MKNLFVCRLNAYMHFLNMSFLCTWLLADSISQIGSPWNTRVGGHILWEIKNFSLNFLTMVCHYAGSKFKWCIILSLVVHFFLHGWSQILIYHAIYRLKAMPLTKTGHLIEFAWFITDLVLQAWLLFPRCDDLHVYTWHVSDNLAIDKIALN